MFENTHVLRNLKRQHHWKCAKCFSCGKSTKGQKRSSRIYRCQVLEENSEVFRHGNSIELDRTLVVSYLVTCKKYGLQRMGFCLVLSQRVSNYITSIEKRKPGCKIEQHFTRLGHTINDYSVLGTVNLENPPRDPTDRPRQFEGY